MWSRRYRVFVSDRPHTSVWVSADFPSPNTLHTLWSALWLAARLLWSFSYVVIERVDPQEATR